MHTRLRAGLRSTAERILADLPETPLYARVDGIERDRALVLLELELIEPDLFLDHARHAPNRFARALVDRLSSSARGGARGPQ